MRIINTLLLVASNSLAIYGYAPIVRSDHRCTDQHGVCQDSSKYDCEDGAYLSGICDGSSSRMCCVPSSDSKCTKYGGQCLDDRSDTCSGSNSWQSGLCDGDSHRKCCVSKDYPCMSMGGTCQSNSNACDGNYLSGYCSGSASIQCCVESNIGDCPLAVYSSPNIKGYYKTVYVEADFVPYMEKIQSIAKSSQVTVYVTQAFRIDGVPVDGAIVPPASHSNHLVGHAIDMNLDTPIGWCNGDCLLAAYLNPSYNSYANNFIKQVQSNGMRWGGVFAPTDPVHIDDGLNVYNDSEWEDLYIYIQPLCQNIST